MSTKCVNMENMKKLINLSYGSLHIKINKKENMTMIMSNCILKNCKLIINCGTHFIYNLY